jgi:hypothetical protein
LPRTSVDVLGRTHTFEDIIECGSPRCDNKYQWTVYKTEPKTFCCSKCRVDAVYGQHVEVVCSNDKCGRTFTKPPHKIKTSKTGYFFCCRTCKDSACSIGGNCSAIAPEHYGTGYRWLISKTETPACVDCGEDRKWALMVHHIDSNRKNNAICNLEVVCSNCHVKRHLDWNGTAWVINYKCLTPRKLLLDL